MVLNVTSVNYSRQPQSSIRVTARIVAILSSSGIILSVPLFIDPASFLYSVHDLFANTLFNWSWYDQNG